MNRPARSFALVFCAALLTSGLAMSQTAPAVPDQTSSDSKAADKSAAYYNFAMGHLYSELAGAFGNRSDYTNKAIEYYRQAMKLDPSASFLAEELTDLYIQAGRIKDAVTEAEELLKRSIEQFQKVTEKDAKDIESWLMLGRLERIAHNSVDAEKAYKKVLDQDASNEEALTGLAMVYSEVGDTRNAIEMLRLVTSKNPNPRTLAALASFYEQNRDYAGAADAWRQALQMDPENGRLKRALAQDVLFTDHFDEALKLYNEIAASDPRDGQVQLRLSEIYRQKGDFAKSRAAFTKAKELDRDSLEVRYDEVSLLEAEGKTDDAIAALKAILSDTAKKNYNESERGSRTMLLERLGMIYRNAGRYNEAVDAFRQIAQVDPNSAPRAAVEVIDTYRTAKDFAKAQDEAQAALKKFPKERIVKLAHASLLADLGKTDEAAAELKTLLNGEKDRETHLVIAQIYEKGKRFDEMGAALDAAEKLSENAQDKQAVLFMRGAMYERMKKYDEAEAEFRKVLAADPENAGALNYLGYMLADRNVRLDEAQKMITRAVQLDPQNGAYLDSLGWVYFRQNRLEEAADYLQRSLQKMAKDPTVHDHLGDVYFKQGKIREAIAQWQNSLKEYEASTQSDIDPAEMATVSKKLESARVRVAKEGTVDKDKQR